MYKCKMTEIFYKNSPYYYSSKPRQQVHNNQGMDFYLKYRWYTIIKQCKKFSNLPCCIMQTLLCGLSPSDIEEMLQVFDV